MASVETRSIKTLLHTLRSVMYTWRAYYNIDNLTLPSAICYVHSNMKAFFAEPSLLKSCEHQPYYTGYNSHNPPLKLQPLLLYCIPKVHQKQFLYDHCSLVSTPAFVACSTNAGVRRPGYKTRVYVVWLYVPVNNLGEGVG